MIERGSWSRRRTARRGTTSARGSSGSRRSLPSGLLGFQLSAKRRPSRRSSPPCCRASRGCSLMSMAELESSSVTAGGTVSRASVGSGASVAGAARGRPRRPRWWPPPCAGGLGGGDGGFGGRRDLLAGAHGSAGAGALPRRRRVGRNWRSRRRTCRPRCRRRTSADSCPFSYASCIPPSGCDLGRFAGTDYLASDDCSSSPPASRWTVARIRYRLVHIVPVGPGPIVPSDDAVR